MPNRRSKKSWQEKSKMEALKLMKEIEKRITSGRLVVTTYGFWTSGNGGNGTLRIDVEDCENIQLSDQS